jgi:thioredoxin-dependent peroxiredoxin
MSEVAAARYGVLAMILSAGVTSACGGRENQGAAPLRVGAKAPDVVAHDLQDRAIRLSSLRGRSVVVYFYPKDETPGCTKEACAFRDAWKRYQEADVFVIGVSTDSRDSHRAFMRNRRLPFPLAADLEGKVGREYGVKKGVFGYERVSFLVGPDGRITHRWAKVDPAVHATQVLDAAKPRG